MVVANSMRMVFASDEVSIILTVPSNKIMASCDASKILSSSFSLDILGSNQSLENILFRPILIFVDKMIWYIWMYTIYIFDYFATFKSNICIHIYIYIFISYMQITYHGVERQKIIIMLFIDWLKGMKSEMHLITFQNIYVRTHALTRIHAQRK